MKMHIINGDRIISNQFTLNLQNGKMEVYKKTSKRKQKALYNKALKYWERAHE